MFCLFEYNYWSSFKAMSSYHTLHELSPQLHLARGRAGREEREERDGKSGRRKDGGAHHLIPHLFSSHVPPRDARDGGLGRRSSSRGAHPRSGLSRRMGAAATPASSQCVQQAEDAARASVKTTVAASGDHGRGFRGCAHVEQRRAHLMSHTEATTDDKMRCPIFSLQALNFIPEDVVSLQTLQYMVYIILQSSFA